MAGILEEYGLDVDAAEELSFDTPDGEYDFTIGDVFVRVGSQKFPDKSWLIIDYLLDNGKKTGELFGLPADASNPDDKEKAVLGRYKSRLLSLGFTEGTLNEVGRDELVGIEGHLTLLTARGYQNVRNLTVPDDGENQFATPEPEAAPAAPAAKAPAKRTPAAPKTALAAPVESAPSADDNPFA